MDAKVLGGDIVRIQRQARFADISNEEWGARLSRLISAQDNVDQVVVSNVRQVGTAAGGSNGTLLFEACYRSHGRMLRRDLVLRFLPVEGLFHTYDVSLQFNLQTVLRAGGAPVPEQLWLDEEGLHLQRPGYVMAQMPGVSAPMTWLASGVIADAAPADRRSMMLSYVDALANLHAMDWQALGLGWMEARASGATPMGREINWYWDALTWSRSNEHLALLAPVRSWLIANVPPGHETVICHGDANLGNYLFENGRVKGVLDWEMSFLGPPECDVVYLYISNEILQSETPLPEGVLTYDEMKAAYEQASGRTLRDLPYFELFTMYRMAVLNVLAMKHFPPEVLETFLSVLERGPRLCIERAMRLGVDV